MLMRTDPFREFDRVAQQVLGPAPDRRRCRSTPSVRVTSSSPSSTFPASDADSIDLDVERNVLTVRAERLRPQRGRELLVAERPRALQPQLFLGDNLDLDRLEARYDSGVLRLTVPGRGAGQAAQDRRGLRRPAGDHCDRVLMGVSTPAGPADPRVVTHGVTATTSTRVHAMEAWADLLVAEDEWVRREFDDIVAAAWSGAGPDEPRTSRGAY